MKNNIVAHVYSEQGFTLMLSFFRNPRERQPPRHPPRLDNVRDNIQYNYRRITEFWHHMNWVVKSDHPFVGILNGLYTSTEDTLTNYRIARDNAITYTAPRGIVTSINYGRVQPKSHFYGSDCREILMEQPFDDAIEQITTKHYTKWEACRVIAHPFTSFDFQLPNGKRRKSGEYGICIIKFDIGLLFAQYIAWRNDVNRSQYEDGTNKSVMNFIHTYPVVGMLRTQTEQAWFNRLYNRAAGLPNNDTREDQRHIMSSPYYHVDEVQDKLLDYIYKSRGNMYDWCSQLPGIFSRNLQQYLKDDIVMVTHQNKMTKYLAELPLLSFLFQTEFLLNNDASNMYRNEFVKGCKALSNGRIFETIKYLDGQELRRLFETRIVDYIEDVIIPL